MRYRLRTLLILLALLPPLLGLTWVEYAQWRAYQRAELERQRVLAEKAAQDALRVFLLQLRPHTITPAGRTVPGNSDYQLPPRPPVSRKT
jgi:hypothetical protein